MLAELRTNKPSNQHPLHHSFFTPEKTEQVVFTKDIEPVVVGSYFTFFILAQTEDCYMLRKISIVHLFWIKTLRATRYFFLFSQTVTLDHCGSGGREGQLQLLLSACQYVLGQDTEIAPDGQTATLHGVLLPLVCAWINERLIGLLHMMIYLVWL